MANYKITKREFNIRLAAGLTSFFVLYTVLPVQEWVQEHTNLNPVVIGAIGFIAVLYFFDIKK